MPAPESIALLIIDMQHDFVLPGGSACVAGARATLPTLRRLLDMARASGWRVLHVVREHAADGSDVEITRKHLFTDGPGVCREGGEGCRIVEELRPLPGERKVVKRRFSAFFGTGLAEALREQGVTTLVLGGTQYPNCIRATAVDGMAHDFRVLVVSDACSAQTDEIAQANIKDLTAMSIACVALDDLGKTLAE